MRASRKRSEDGRYHSSINFNRENISKKIIDQLPIMKLLE
jgi:hypothetical protein